MKWIDAKKNDAESNYWKIKRRDTNTRSRSEIEAYNRRRV